MEAEQRREHDLLGDREVPSAAYYGVHILRAVENCPITGIALGIYPDLIRALARSSSRRLWPIASCIF